MSPSPAGPASAAVGSSGPAVSDQRTAVSRAQQARVQARVLTRLPPACRSTVGLKAERCPLKASPEAKSVMSRVATRTALQESF
jgi:hypothetical protein